MNRIDRLIRKLNAATGDCYEVWKHGRGDWSLYRNGEYETNAMSADAMADYIAIQIANARTTECHD